MPDKGVVDREIEIELSYQNIENLKNFSNLTGKGVNRLLDEALSQYFKNEQERAIKKSQEDESMMTNLDFDEFWEGVEI